MNMNQRFLDIRKQANDKFDQNLKDESTTELKGRQELFYEMIVNHAVECVRDVVRDEDSNLSWENCQIIQQRLRDFFRVYN